MSATEKLLAGEFVVGTITAIKPLEDGPTYTVRLEGRDYTITPPFPVLHDVDDEVQFDLRVKGDPKSAKFV